MYSGTPVLYVEWNGDVYSGGWGRSPPLLLWLEIQPASTVSLQVTVVESSMSTMSEGASEPTCLDSQTQGPSEDPTTVVLPNPSPRKGVCGSFLHRGQSPRRAHVSAPERSPAAKSMDDVLARSRAKQQEALEGGGVSPSKGREGKSPGLSVRRKLSLNKDAVRMAAQIIPSCRGAFTPPSFPPPSLPPSSLPSSLSFPPSSLSPYLPSLPPSLVRRHTYP